MASEPGENTDRVRVDHSVIDRFRVAPEEDDLVFAIGKGTSFWLGHRWPAGHERQ